jgi:hypothetical protein
MSNSAVDTSLPGQYDAGMESVKTRRLAQVSLPPELYDLVLKVAREQDRPVSNLLRLALVRYLREIGELPTEID